MLNALGGSLNSSVVSSDPRSASSIPSPSSAGSGGTLASAVAAGSAAAGVRVGTATGALAADFSARSGSVAGSYSTASSQIDSGMSAAAVRMASENIHDPSESAYDLANITGGSELDFRLKSSAVSAFSEIGGGGFMYLNPNYPQNETEFHSVLSSAVNANPNLDSGMKKMLTEGSTGSASVLSGGKPLHTFADGKPGRSRKRTILTAGGSRTTRIMQIVCIRHCSPSTVPPIKITMRCLRRRISGSWNICSCCLSSGSCFIS